jgi:MoaA/NifB/PqqE/SkfB family radical SAM enzyme
MPDIAWVDTVDVCHLKCPTCYRGVRGMENSARVMPIDMFATIVARLRQDGFGKIGLYNWTEPFLNRRLHEFVAIAKAAGLWISISSTLSLRRIPNLEATLAAGVDSLTVSTSGTDQATHEINHVRANLAYTRENLARVREIIDRCGLSTRVDYRFLRFDYNAHQIPAARDYAERMGFNFDEITGNGDPKSNMFVGIDDEHYVRAVKAGAALPQPSPEESGKSCDLMFDQMAIDCSGDVYLCCAVPNYPSVRIGKFLELTADEILARKFVNPFCRGCTVPRRDRAATEEARLQGMQDLIAKARKANADLVAA